MTDLTEHQIRVLDEYLAHDNEQAARKSSAVVSIVQAIPNLEQRMSALAQRRAHHRQSSCG